MMFTAKGSFVCHGLNAWNGSSWNCFAICIVFISWNCSWAKSKVTERSLKQLWVLTLKLVTRLSMLCGQI